MVKSSGGVENEGVLVKTACDKLREFGDDYCDYVPKLCSLNNAGNPEGVPPPPAPLFCSGQTDGSSCMELQGSGLHAKRAERRVLPPRTAH